MRTCAIVYGFVFITFGALGFFGWGLPFLESNMWLNIFYLVIGALALFCLLFHRTAVRIYFQIVGIWLAIIGIGNFVFLERKMMLFVESNAFSTWVMITAAVVALLLGFGSKNEKR